MKKYFLIWLVIWGLIALGITIFVEDKSVLMGVGLAALISLIFMVKSLQEAWAGEVVEIKKERVAVNRGDDTDWEDQTFAYIKLSSGKTKKKRCGNNWQVGTKLEKKKGETGIRILQ